MHPGLYLHIPFCSRICPYCDFSVLTGGPEARERFVGRLIEEIRLWGEDEQALAPFAGIDTVYFGGGTPSALAPEQLERILAAAREHLAVRPGAAVSFEANPEDVTPEAARAWRGLGVRFLSLGVQSLDAEALRFLGRRHSPEEARRAMEIARAAGFETVSIDLIYGLPGQALEGWRRVLEQAVALQPDHLSCYQLTIHEGTPFGFRLERGKLEELPEERQADLFLFTHRSLADAGLPGYEVSNFACSPEHRSRHNRKYWHHVPYLGLGPSAHSFSGAARWWNERKVKPWEARVEAGERPIAGREELSREDLAVETLLLGLRTREGVDLELFEQRFGVDLLAENAGLVERLEGEGLLRVASGGLAGGAALVPTLEGWAVADSLARDFEVGTTSSSAGRPSPCV